MLYLPNMQDLQSFLEVLLVKSLYLPVPQRVHPANWVSIVCNFSSNIARTPEVSILFIAKTVRISSTFRPF